MDLFFLKILVLNRIIITWIYKKNKENFEKYIIFCLFLKFSYNLPENMQKISIISGNIFII